MRAELRAESRVRARERGGQCERNTARKYSSQHVPVSVKGVGNAGTCPRITYTETTPAVIPNIKSGTAGYALGNQLKLIFYTFATEVVPLQQVTNDKTA